MGLGVSVVIATYNRPATVVSAAESVLAQLSDDAELVVIDQTPEYPPEVQARIDCIASHERVRWIRGGPPSLPAARNYGIEIARGDIVVFVDDDVELLPGFVAGHQQSYAEAEVVGVTGRVLRPDASHSEAGGASQPPRIRIGGWIVGRADSTSPGATNALYGCNMSVRRSLAVAVGGFDTGFIGNAFREDAEFASRLRVHGRLVFNPNAALIHYEAPTGGARQGRPNEADPSLYRNEVRFFRSAYSPWLLPVWFVSIARRSVVCGPALREHNIVSRAKALFAGTALGLVRPAPRAAKFVPSHDLRSA